MKKLFVILVALLFTPVLVNAAGNITTDFDTETCILTVSGEQTGHEATVSLFDNNGLIGFKTGEINNDNYSVDFVIGKDTASTINITVSNENGGNEIEKNNVQIPACTPPEPETNNELFDGHGNSIIINDSSLGFEEGYYLEIEMFNEEKIEELLSYLEGTEYYEPLKRISDSVLDRVGPYREFLYYLTVKIKDEHGYTVDYSNYNKKFVLNLAIPRQEYAASKGLRLSSFDEDALTMGKEFDYGYDEENEILSLTIDRPTGIVVYLDNEYDFLDKTANQKYSLATGDTLTLKVDANRNKFVDVFVDGKLVDPENYTIKSGSTVVTFKKDYMQSLSKGDHTVDVHFRDGTASTTMSVVKDDQASNPLTGDNILLYIIIIAISSIGIYFTVIQKKLKNN